MGESKVAKTLKMLLPQMGCMLVAAAGIGLLKYLGLTKQNMDRMLCDIVLAVLGIGVAGLHLRMSALREELDYDNGEHTDRFWLCFLIGLAVAFICVFLPAGAWPFLAVFVSLGLFANQSAGILSGAVLLMIPVCLTGSGVEVFASYLICGLFGNLLFHRLKNGFKAGELFFLSLGCLLVCVTAGTVLTANIRPKVEHFLVPAANVMLSGVLLLGVMKYFSAKVVYRYRENFLDLNDPENEFLTALKNRDKRAYMKNIHTAYFCERIAVRLGFDPDVLKCVGYYHGTGEALTEFMQSYPFPPQVVTVLEEYGDRKNAILHKETAVVTAAEDVVGAIFRRMDEGERSIDYDGLIDAIFEKYHEEGAFIQCDITMRELCTMQKIFKEEKLYYDFLR